MNESNEWSLKSWINRMLEDGIKKIKSRDLSVFAHHDSETIEESLKKWEEKGILRILKPYRDCEPNDHCVEMLGFIDQKSPIKGYMDGGDDKIE